MKKISEQIVAGKHGLGPELQPGEHLRIVDNEGPKAVDMGPFNLQNLARNRPLPVRGPATFLLISGTACPGTGTGDTLVSTLCRPMMTVIDETAPEKGCPLESGDCNGGKSTPVRVERYTAADAGE
jgi:uncharacterized protein YcgI (DUF1989 family)